MAAASRPENLIGSLHEAAMAGYADLIKQLLDAGENPNRRDENGNTPLMLAAMGGQTKATLALVKGGADALAQNAQGKTALQLACDEATREACRKGEARRAQEEQACKAIEGGQADALKDLLKKGVSVEAKSPDGSLSLLGYALARRQDDCAVLLLQRKAKMDLALPGGKSMLMLAGGGNCPKAIKLMLAQGTNALHQGHNGATALHDAVYTNSREAVEALLPAYASVNYSPDGGGNGTPIEMALHRNHVELVEIFLKAGLKPNDARFKTPLMVQAVQKGSEPMVLSLFRAGADPKAKDAEGKCALDYAQGDMADLLNDAKKTF